ncbi:hypothetical protein C2E23DRAFT_881307 [Lenzites betulinus]|nr:hypothetical protein C2E23DRAFT_881307 [Lenzites betulinus]
MIKESWATLKEEFRKEWVKKDAQDLTDHDMLAMLKINLPTNKELLEFDTRNGQPISGLVQWAQDVSNDVLKYCILDCLAKHFQLELKAVVLRGMLPIVASWKEFNNTIKGLQLAKLKDRITVMEAYSLSLVTLEQLKANPKAGRAPVTIDDLNNLVV